MKKDEDGGEVGDENLFISFIAARGRREGFARRVTVCTVRATPLICTRIGDPSVIPRR